MTEEKREQILMIGTFMKVQVRTNTDGTVSYRPDKYWESLMGVWEAIEDRLFVTSIQYSQKYYRAEIHEHPQLPNTIGAFTPILGQSKDSRREAVFSAVVSFIEWYHNNQK
jgi:hypothetical protein